MKMSEVQSRLVSGVRRSGAGLEGFVELVGMICRWQRDGLEVAESLWEKLYRRSESERKECSEEKQ